MKSLKIVLILLMSIVSVCSNAQSDLETIRELLGFKYFPDPTVDTSNSICPHDNMSLDIQTCNNQVVNGTETGKFWNDSGIDDLQNFVRAVLRDPGDGGEVALQHSIAEILRLNNRPILIYLWNDASSLQASQYAHDNKPCISDYDRTGTSVSNHVWPCANHTPTDTNWGGFVHMGQFYATDNGYDSLKSTFIHEIMHTQDPVNSFNNQFVVNGHLYRYGFDDGHFDIEAVPNRRMAYAEGIANTVSLVYSNRDLNTYLRWYARNGDIMVETQTPPWFFRAFSSIMGYSDDIWLYDQIREVHGAGTPDPDFSGYETYKIRNLNAKFITHNEMTMAMSLGITSLYVRDIDPFMHAVSEVNIQIRTNQQQDPFALILNKFAEGLTSDGISLADTQNQLQTMNVQDEPYYSVLPLAYFDFFTGYGTRSKNEFNALFNNQINMTLLDIYWDYFKDRVRTVSIPPELERSSVPPSVIWEILTDISIQCGVNQSLLPGVRNFNFEPAESPSINSSQATDVSNGSTEATPVEDSDNGTSDSPAQADGSCRDWPSFGTETSVTANGVTVPVFNATEGQKRNIEQTLARLPVNHLKAIPRIIIVSNDGPNYFLSHPERGGASWRCSPANRANEWIKISAYSLTERRNQRINFTLLHEIGHFIDRDFNIVSGHQEEARRYLRETNYRGHTQGSGEAIAQGYMYYFASTTAQERNPRVRDRLPVYLKEILENSSAWANNSTW